jgi:hypothetical protein
MRALAIALTFAALGLLAGAAPARAHRTSDAFLAIEVRGSELSGSWDIALRDLDVAEDLDADRDRSLTWGEIRRARARVEADLMQKLAIRGERAACALRIDDLMLDDRIEGRFAHFALSGSCPELRHTLTVDYRFLFDADPSHRGILALNARGAARTAVFSPLRSEQQFALDAPGAQPLLDFVREGVHHIWIGADHVLFLCSLLLPCVLVRSRRQWYGVERLVPALRRVTGVVTAFTAAHSITLLLAARDIVSIPSRITESAIALTVLLAALDNIWPVATGSRRPMAFGFGLIHGFGFASVLGELNLPADARLPALLAFNVGVELGQLAILAAVVPLAFAIRNTPNYRDAIVPGGSLAVAGVALVWLVQRIGGG